MASEEEVYASGGGDVVVRTYSSTLDAYVYVITRGKLKDAITIPKDPLCRPVQPAAARPKIMDFRRVR